MQVLWTRPSPRITPPSRQPRYTAVGLRQRTGRAARQPSGYRGLAILDAGGDFADGVIAFDGQWLGGEVFVSFDKTAVALLDKGGTATPLLP